MSPGETVSRSPLDKPLNQLTEDDISQVTREDCRRYLKEKGMRRPSWNKSQAIQQVVSDSTVLPNETTQRNGISGPVNESVPYPRPDPSKSDFSGDYSVRTAISGNGSVSPRTAGAAKEPAGQMTIFYCGKVNVYDDMPGCKAEAILQLAASPVSFPQETLADQRTAPWSIPCHLEATGVKISPCSPMVIMPSLQTVKVAENCQFPLEESNLSHEDSLEGPATRKASLQRYLEKRKDRFKNKRKLATSSSPTLDLYLNQVGDQFSNEQLKQSVLSFRCSSNENVPKTRYTS
ncbi:protein TIFY 4B-like isoform X2 [Durio zibethinus]|uniref:Protein TIFY n=1 Tax=Durio zibethinus TaxID=66656 RepID=A0A6P6B1Y3_DURZI|nr:protein TIFY 4B-like isoform X2 [Durio zibethinus]